MATNKDAVAALYDAFSRGDVPAVLGAFDPAIEWNEAEHFRYADGNPYRGPDAVAAGVFQRIVGDVADFTVTPEALHEAGDTVVATGRYTGSVRATGRPVNAQFVHVWRLKDGRVTRFQQYTDTLHWAEAFGG